MVIKDVTDGISIKINELFGDEYEIYKLVNFNENNEMSTAATMLITFLVVATIIIIMIMIWLINYMIWNI